MSIRLRLILAIGLLFAVAFGAMMTLLTMQAQPRIAAENESIEKLSRDLVRFSMRSLADADNLKPALAALVSDLNELKYVNARLASAPAKQNLPSAEPTSLNPVASFWRSLLQQSDPVPFRVPVVVADKAVDTIHISPRVSEEIDQVVQTGDQIMIAGAILTLGVFLLTWFVTNRALAPIGALNSAMVSMEGGDFNVAVPIEGPPEIAGIARRLNQLATALAASVAENKRLTSQLVHVQDEERREIARELHDELGPYLFSIRATGTSLKRELEKPSMDAGKAARAASSMLEHIDSIQQTNRRVLQTLAPAGLIEVGLSQTLDSLVDSFRISNPDVELALSVSLNDKDLDDASRLTVYRVVQESVTNAFRHAQATRVEVDVAAEGESVAVSVRDNGQGFRPDARPSRGITGMRERVSALGGKLTVNSTKETGTEVRAHVPLGCHRPRKDSIVG